MNKEMFVVSVDAKEERINNNAENFLNQISNNCQKGISTTRIECEEFFEVIERVETKLKELGINYRTVSISSLTGSNGRRWCEIKIINV
jgi:hypothetical protein